MHIVIDKDGNPWGPFEKATEAAQWAVKKWPNVPEYDPDNINERIGYWQVVALRGPND